MQSRRGVRLALALGLVFASLGLAGPAAAASVTGTIRLDQPSYQVASGGTVSVTVISSTSVPISGVSASITFDKTILQVTAIQRASAWASAPFFIAGDAAAIAKANQKGVLQAVAASFFPPTSVPAGDQQFVTVTFKAIGCGSVTMTLPTGRVDSAMLDGRAKTYGGAISVKTTGATVTACQGAAGGSASPGPSGSIDPNASPSASADPGASAPADSPSAGPLSSDALLPSAAPSAAPADTAGGSGAASGGLAAEQNSWLTFALAALAVSAAGLALLILVLTIVAISAAVIGAVVVFRVWRRTADNDARAAAPAPATTHPASESGDETPTESAPDEAPGEAPARTTDGPPTMAPAQA